MEPHNCGAGWPWEQCRHPKPWEKIHPTRQRVSEKNTCHVRSMRENPHCFSVCFLTYLSQSSAPVSWNSTIVQGAETLMNPSFLPRGLGIRASRNTECGGNSLRAGEGDPWFHICTSTSAKQHKSRTHLRKLGRGFKIKLQYKHHLSSRLTPVEWV